MTRYSFVKVFNVIFECTAYLKVKSDKLSESDIEAIKYQLLNEIVQKMKNEVKSNPLFSMTPEEERENIVPIETNYRQYIKTLEELGNDDQCIYKILEAKEYS